MARKSKAKRTPHGGVSHKKKRKPSAHKKPAVAHEAKSLPERRKEAARKHAASMSTLLADKPKHRHQPFVAAAPPHPIAAPPKKRKKKQVVTLRFTENTLKDIAALECVRRCFR